MFRCQFFMSVKPMGFEMGFRNKDLRSKMRIMVLRATHQQGEQVDRLRTIGSGTGPAV